MHDPGWTGIMPLLSLIAVVLGCASPAAQPVAVEPPLSIDSIQEIEVKTSGASVECHFVEQPFAGQVYLRTGTGKRLPGTQVEFWTVGASGEPELLKVRADDTGGFNTTVTIVNHYYGSSYRRGNMSVTLRAPGCRAKQLQVDDGWQPRTITLRCPEMNP